MLPGSSLTSDEIRSLIARRLAISESDVTADQIAEALLHGLPPTLDFLETRMQARMVYDDAPIAFMSAKKGMA